MLSIWNSLQKMARFNKNLLILFNLKGQLGNSSQSMLTFGSLYQAEQQQNTRTNKLKLLSPLNKLVSCVRSLDLSGLIYHVIKGVTCKIKRLLTSGKQLGGSFSDVSPGWTVN